MHFNKSIVHQATDLHHLERAWRRVASNRGCAGSDQVTCAEFRLSLLSRLGRLQNEVRSGQYRPRALLEVLIPKPNGGQRKLLIPAIRDRILQTAVVELVTPELEKEFESSSFGYRPGRGVDQAVRQIRHNYLAGYRWVVDADIERYFDRICHERLMQQTAKQFKDPDFQALLWLWLKGRIHGPDHDYVAMRGVAQGSPLSPILSNLYLDPFDEQFEHDSSRLIRYADDFLVMCKTHQMAQTILRKVRRVLGLRGLRLNSRKTRIVHFDQGFKFLGHQFVRSLVVKGW